MNFTPKTEEEIQKEGLFAKGEYAFEVLDASDKTSQNGNEMIELKLEVFSNDGESSRNLHDYLLAKIAYKVRHFCNSTGLMDKYNSGTLKASDCIHKTGLCKVVVQEDRAGQFPPKNSVQDYILERSDAKPAESKPGSQQEPF